MEDRIVFLSPSTQDKNIGVNDYGSEEFRMNQIADELQRLLEENNFVVYRNDPEGSVRDSVAMSNSINPDIHVAIHSNASNGAARGPEIYTNRENTAGDRLAKLIYDRILGIYPDQTLGRGVRYTDALYEVINTTSPSVLLEVAFHDNIEDERWIVENIENIAMSIFQAIDEYFNTRYC